MPTSRREDLEQLHRRIRLTEFAVETGGERTEGRVVLAWEPGDEYVGRAEGATTMQGQLRCAAEATAKALEAASHGRVSLEVLAVKAVEGFDTVIVVVSLASRLGDLTERLVGSCLIKGQAPRGAVLATLTATNRLFGRMVHDAA
jgi:hypothetical protein